MRLCFIVQSLHFQRPSYTTTHLAYEAFRRGHEVCYTTLNRLTLKDNGQITARATYSSAARGRERFLAGFQNPTALERQISLSQFDVVFLRNNPHDKHSDTEPAQIPILDLGRQLSEQGVFVINHPAGLALASSKLYVTQFPASIRAKTLVSREPTAIKQFLAELEGPAIIKPLRGFGGFNVFFIRRLGEKNLNQIIAAVCKNDYAVVQEYLPAIRHGDRRILLVNGSPLFFGNQATVYSRRSPKDEIRCNIHIGASRQGCRLFPSDQKIVDTIRNQLIKDGLYFVGVDVVGNKLLEINVFCPGGIHSMNELYSINVGQRVIEDLEGRVGQVQHTPSPLPLHSV